MTAEAFDYTGLYIIILTESYRDQYNIITRGKRSSAFIFHSTVAT